MRKLGEALVIRQWVAAFIGGVMYSPTEIYDLIGIETVEESQQSHGRLQPPAEEWQQLLISKLAVLFKNENIPGVIMTACESLSWPVMLDVAYEVFGQQNIITIACSRFSRQIAFGSLLFLLAESEQTDTTSELEVFWALRRNFGKLRIADRPIVFIEHPELLDPQSEGVLARLVACRVIRLVILCDRLEQLSSGLVALLRQQVLVLLDPVTMSNAELRDYVEVQLGGQISPFAMAHLQIVAGGDIVKLDHAVTRLFDSGALRNEGGVWVIEGPLRLPHDGDMRPIEEPKTREGMLLSRIRSERGLQISDISGDENAMRALDELFRQRMVRYVGPGIVSPATRSLPFGSVGNIDGMDSGANGTLDDIELGAIAEAITAGCYAGALDRLTVLKKRYEEESIASKSELNLQMYTTTVWNAHMGLQNYSAAGRALGSLATPDEINVDSSSYLDDDYAVQRWYMALVEGVLHTSHQEIPGPASWRQITHEDHWSNDPNRMLGVLCIAYRWAVEGALVEARGLLAWATDQIQRLSRTPQSPSFRMAYPHMLYAGYTTSLVLFDMEMMSKLDRVVKTSLFVDPAASQCAAFFQIWQMFMTGESGRTIDESSAVLGQIDVQVDAQMRRQAQVIRIGLRAAAGHPSEVKTLESAASQTSCSVWAWATSHLSLTIMAAHQRDDSVGTLALALSREALAHGFVTCAGESLMLALATRTFDGELLVRLREEFGVPLAGAEPLMLLDSLLDGDLDTEFSIRARLANNGRAHFLVLGTRKVLKEEPAIRRMVQRASAQLRRASRVVDTKENTAVSASLLEEPLWAKSLTNREQTIAMFVERGLSNAEVAGECGISVRTVEGHLYQILAKLNLRNRRELQSLVRAYTSKAAQ